MKKIFQIAKQFQLKLAADKPDGLNEVSLAAYMVENDLPEFRMGNVLYSMGGLAEVHSRQLEQYEIDNWPDLSEKYRDWYSAWEPETELYPEGWDPEEEEDWDPNEPSADPREITAYDAGVLAEALKFYLSNQSEEWQEDSKGMLKYYESLFNKLDIIISTYKV